VNETGPEDSLGEIVRRLAGRGAKRRLAPVDRVAAAWREAAGANLADVARVRSLRDGVLVVAVHSAPLCHELASFRREELLGALNDRLAAAGAPAVRSLIFRIGAS
jgi:predicted nucleic acid-binding Zn ribbon protein